MLPPSASGKAVSRPGTYRHLSPCCRSSTREPQVCEQQYNTFRRACVFSCIDASHILLVRRIIVFFFFRFVVVFFFLFAIMCCVCCRFSCFMFSFVPLSLDGGLVHFLGSKLSLFGDLWFRMADIAGLATIWQLWSKLNAAKATSSR